jgi:predicted small lipoprotein YifL
MRSLLVLVVIVTLAACGKKPAPTGAKAPPPESTEPAKESGDESKEMAPSRTGSDPCEGGEGNKTKTP